MAGLLYLTLFILKYHQPFKSFMIFVINNYIFYCWRYILLFKNTFMGSMSCATWYSMQVTNFVTPSAACRQQQTNKRLFVNYTPISWWIWRWKCEKPKPETRTARLICISRNLSWGCFVSVCVRRGNLDVLIL